MSDEATQQLIVAAKGDVEACDPAGALDRATAARGRRPPPTAGCSPGAAEGSLGVPPMSAIAADSLAELRAAYSALPAPLPVPLRTAVTPSNDLLQDPWLAIALMTRPTMTRSCAGRPPVNPPPRTDVLEDSK